MKKTSSSPIDYHRLREIDLLFYKAKHSSMIKAIVFKGIKARWVVYYNTMHLAYKKSDSDRKRGAVLDGSTLGSPKDEHF